MKRYMTCVGILLLTGMLASCGGDSSGGGGNPGTSNGGSGASDGNSAGGGNTAVAPSVAGRVEESDSKVTLSPGWTQADARFAWSGDAAVQSKMAGATATFIFTGTSVRWLGSRGRGMGIASVKLDGQAVRDVDLFARPTDEIRTPVITLNGLSEGQHTLTIEVTGRKHPEATSNVVVVDAFDVQPQNVSHLQDTDPNAKFSAGWTKASTAPPWSGSGVSNLPELPVTAQITETAGAKVTLPFRGTGIGWVGSRGPNGGIALVSVDGGAPTEVDTYFPSDKFQALLFTASGLTDTPHTLTIEATGRKNGASAGAQIAVDAFDVMTPGKRYEEYYRSSNPNDPKITYTGEWNLHNDARVWSEGATSTSNVAGSTVTFSFTGTSVSWIGAQKASAGGHAKVFLDDVEVVKEISLSRRYPIEGYQMTNYRVDGLTNARHELKIEVISTNGSYVVVDAFDVRP